MGDFTNKTTVVTGASRGIGRAIAVKFASEGGNLVLTGRDEAMLNESAELVRSAGGRAATIAADLRKPESAVRIASFAREQFGSVDILVNNAGATKRAEFTDLTEGDWQDGFALKFFGAVRLTRELWVDLKSRRGSLIFISGSGGRTPGAQFAVGGSVNAALLSLTKALAETGIRDGVQVNCVNPGPVRTDRLESRLAAISAQHGIGRDEALESLIREQQIARVAEPEEIAALVAFIAGPNGRSLQGALIDIDGGATKTI